MKKVIYAVLAVFVIAFTFTSCKTKKPWHCTCSYNNVVMYQEDLQLQTKDNAAEQCAKYDSTVAGQVWSCTIY